MQCTKCSELFFCNRECLRRSWHLHKKVCGAPRRWVSVELAIERLLAMYKPGEPPVPKAACYICLEEGDVMRNCACRGDAGCVHLECLVELIERNPQQDTPYFCPLCHQMYAGRRGVGIVRMMWQRARNTDHPNLYALGGLAGALQRHGEVEAVASLRADMPGDSLIDMLTRAEAHLKAGRYHEAIECVDRAAEADDRLGLILSKIKVKALMSLGQFNRAARVARIAVEQSAKEWGGDNRSWLLAKFFHAMVLKDAGRRKESRAMLRAILPVQTKLLGRDHVETRDTAVALAALG